MSVSLTKAYRPMPVDYDFLEFVAFQAKAENEGSYTYAFEHYGPVFRSPDLRHLETSFTAFMDRLGDVEDAIEAWWTAHNEDGVDIINAHMRESGDEEARRFTWGYVTADGGVHAGSEAYCRDVNSDTGFGLKRREHADAPWVDATSE